MSDDVGPETAAARGDAVAMRRVRVQNARPLLWALLAATLGSHALLLWVNRHSIADGSYDFVAFYSAAQIVKSGYGNSLYAIPTQRQFQQEFPKYREYPLLFNHPAFEVLFYLPLAYFSFSTAFVLWMVVNLGILCIVLFLLSPYLGNLRESLGSKLLVMLAFSFFPISIVLIQGQDSILFLLLFVLAFVDLQRGREWRAGCFAALAMFRFQLIIPLILALALRKRLKVMSGFLISSLILVLISLWITGRNGLLEYVGLLREMDQAARSNMTNEGISYIHSDAMSNLRGFLDVYLRGRIPEEYLISLIFVLSCLFFFWSLSKGVGVRSSGQTGSNLPFALHTTVILLVSYHMNLHDLTLLLLPLLLVANHLAGGQEGRNFSRLGLILLLPLLFLNPVYVLLLLVDRLSLLALVLVAFALLISARISCEKRRFRVSI